MNTRQQQMILAHYVNSYLYNIAMIYNDRKHQKRYEIANKIIKRDMKVIARAK